MTRQFSRRAFTSLLLATGATGSWANPPSVSLRPQARGSEVRRASAPSAEEIVAGAGLGGTVGFSVVDLNSGNVLESRNSKIALPPASVTKAITALYALDTLGAEYRFSTRVMATGPVSNGVLQGDLILVGGGDPTLDTDGIASLAASVRKAGLHEVRGKFLVYGGRLPFVRAIEPGQPEHVGYNPAVSGLNLNFNRVHFEWKRAGSGYSLALDARSEKYRPKVRVARMKIANRTTPVYTYTDKGGLDHWTVSNQALGKGGSRWLPVRRPEIYAGEVFQTFMGAHGVRLTAPEHVPVLPDGLIQVAARRSAALSQILQGMLKYSTNLTAEAVGMTATLVSQGEVGDLKESGRSMTRWAKETLGMTAARFEDHSGLSDGSRVIADDIAVALGHVRKSTNLNEILKKIAIRDERRRVIQDHPIQVRAKTGTLNFVSSLAGYMVTKNGTELAFAIFAADMGRRSRIPQAQRERPQGARDWNRRAKAMQQKLIERWGAAYSG